MRTLLVWGVGALILLALLPVGITMAGQELTASLTAANSSLDAVQPTLSKFAFGIAAVAVVFGGVLLAVGHGRGKAMVKGAFLLALIGAGSGALLNYLGAQGPGLAGTLVGNVGQLLSTVAARIP